MTRFATMVAWSDVPHLSPEAQAGLISAYLPHERDARSKGIPQLGAGAIYPVSEDDFVVPVMAIPPWWPRAYGLDVGWNRTAAVWGAHDRETDTVYLYAEHYRAHAEPSIHAAAIRAKGEWMIGAIDPASRGRGQRDGEQLFRNYVDLGLNLTPALNGVEAGLFEVWQRLSTGRLKVFASLSNWLQEFRLYRRNEKGAVVKEGDHLMDAGRYLLVTGIGNASVDPDYLRKAGHHKPGLVHDYDPYAAHL